MIKITNKLALMFWGVMSLVLFGYFIIYYSSVEIFTRILFGLASSSMILALIEYRVQSHISIFLLFINQLILLGISILTQSEVYSAGNSLTELQYITPELLISTIGVFSGTYMCIRKLKKQHKRLNLENILKLKLTPFKISGIANFVIIGMIISVIMIMAIPMRVLMTQDTILPTAMMLLPSLILLISIVPIEITPYIRFVYYILWISVIQMMIAVDGYGIANMLEPFIYIVSIVIGNRYSVWVGKADKIKEDKMSNIGEK